MPPFAPVKVRVCSPKTLFFAAICWRTSLASAANRFSARVSSSAFTPATLSDLTTLFSSVRLSLTACSVRLISAFKLAVSFLNSAVSRSASDAFFMYVSSAFSSYLRFV